MVTSPHAMVCSGSHILGDTFFRTKLLGISLSSHRRQSIRSNEAFWQLGRLAQWARQNVGKIR